MGDHENGPAVPRFAFQPFCNQAHILPVKAAGGLIKNQYPAAGKDGAGNGKPLDAAGDAALTGSDALIYRLLFNLTENAVKYNRLGGSVRVELAQGQEKCIIRVSDTGCGIPEEYQRSIFHPFFRVDKSRSREYGGAGLGLSLVWEIANLHGGSVWVEESSDKGTTIAVELPAGAENDSLSVDIPLRPLAVS